MKKRSSKLLILALVLALLALPLAACGNGEEPTPTPTPSVVADFSASPTLGKAPVQVQFTDESTGDVATWAWDFESDGTVDSSERNPSHTYADKGDYTVSLTVTRSDGSDDTETKVGYIRVGDLLAGFIGSPTSGTIPLLVQFTDQSVGDITGWEWDLNGDGTVDSTAQNPSHTYGAAGQYNVTLTVTAAAGTDTHTETNYIVAKESVVVYFPGFFPGSGYLAQTYAPMLISLNAWVDYINNESPIPGVTLESLFYDSKYDPAEAQPGYTWLKAQGALFVSHGTTVEAETLKNDLDQDSFVMFVSTPTPAILTPPGTVFAYADYALNGLAVLDWVSTKWDYGTKGIPKIGGWGYNIPYSVRSIDEAQAYCEANPTLFDWVDGPLAPYGTTSWFAEVETLKDCDYLINACFGSGVPTFINEYRAKGYDGVFINTDAHLGFWTLIEESVPLDRLDGSLSASVIDPEVFMPTFDKVLGYMAAADRPTFEAMIPHQQAFYILYYLMVEEVLRNAVEAVGDPSALTSEAIFTAAKSFVMDLEGYPEGMMKFDATRRVLIDQAMMYEFSAAAGKWLKIGDWVPVPGM
ncbi:PKD domain-containing protein [Chloroflexota bacterium]